MDAFKVIEKFEKLLQIAIDLNCKTLTIDIEFCKELLTALKYL